MREGLVFNHIFPISGPASAKFMRLKADCLLHAGVINAAERDLVYVRSAGVLEPAGVVPRLLSAIPREPFAPEAAAGSL